MTGTRAKKQFSFNPHNQAGCLGTVLSAQNFKVEPSRTYPIITPHFFNSSPRMFIDFTEQGRGRGQRERERERNNDRLPAMHALTRDRN